MVVKQIWAQFGRAEVDLFAMALSDDPPLAGGRVCIRAMAKEAALHLSTAASHSPSPGESEARTSVSHPSAVTTNWRPTGHIRPARHSHPARTTGVTVALAERLLRSPPTHFFVYNVS